MATLVSGFANCVQLNVAVVAKVVTATAVGFVHVGAGAHVTLAIQPALVVDPSEVNTKVKHPPGTVDDNDGGRVVPWYVPNKGADALLPSYTFKWSQQFCVLNAVKVTVTKFVEVSAQTYVVVFSLFW